MKEFKSFLKYRKEDKCPYPWHLDVYGCGCPSECRFCYAKSLLSFRGLWNPCDPSVADMKKLEKSVKKNLKPGDLVRIGGMTDNFQPIEGQLHAMRDAIGILNDHGVSYLILSKYARVASDEMMAVYDRRLAHFQLTLTSTDDDFCAKYELADKPSARIRAIERLQYAGFDTQIRLSPLCVDFIDNGHLSVDALAAIKCDKMLIEFLRVNSWIRKWFSGFFNESRYSLKSRSFNHLQLEEKVSYADKIIAANPSRSYTFAEYVPEHHDYFVKNYNANPCDCCNLAFNNETESGDGEHQEV